MSCLACHKTRRGSPFRRLCSDCGYKALELRPAPDSQLIRIRRVLQAMQIDIVPEHLQEAEHRTHWKNNFADLLIEREP